MAWTDEQKKSFLQAYKSGMSEEQAKQAAGISPQSTANQPVGVNGPVVAANASPVLGTKGNGSFTSVDDYLDKTGQRAINDANRLATYDSQMYQNALTDAQRINSNNVGNKLPAQSKSGLMLAEDAATGQANPVTATQLVQQRRESDENYQKLANKMEATNTNYNRNHPAQYDTASEALTDYNTKIADMEREADAFASKFSTDKNSEVYKAMYASKTTGDDGYNALVEARNEAQTTADQDASDKEIRELFGDNDTDIKTLRMLYEMLQSAQKKDDYVANNYGNFGAGDKIVYDNSENQTHTINGNEVQPTRQYNKLSAYMDGAPYRWGLTREAEQAAKSEGYKPLTQDYYKYVYDYMMGNS